MIVLLWGNLRRLSAGKKSASFFTFSLILQRYRKFVVLGTLGMPGYVRPKWYYYLIENFYVYLQVKNQLPPPCLYGDIAKIWKLVLHTFACLVTLTQNGTISLLKPLMFIWMQKINLSFTSFLRYYSLTNPGIWLADSILAHNSRILPDMVVKYQ